MDSASMLGVALVVLVMFLARRVGWQDDDARPWFGFAVLLFAVSILCTPLAISDSEPGWIVAAGVFTAIGVLVLFAGMTKLTRLGEPTNEERPATPEE